MLQPTSSVAVIGAGTMGSGIAIVAAMAGRDVVLHDASIDVLENASERIRRFIDGGVRRGKLTEQEARETNGRVELTSSIESVSEAGLVIEAIIEDLEVKQSLLTGLDDVCDGSAVIATNTSTLSITSIAAGSRRPERVIGMHFCNPAPLMKLVEIVPGELTSPATTSDALVWTDALGKRPVVCRDRPGFILNRLLVPFENDCIRALERGEGSVADIDLAVQEGLRYPMGPFRLLDIVGLDVHKAVSDSLFRQLHDPRFAAPSLVDRMIDSGHLGRKSGVGFYQYNDVGAFGE